MGRGSSKDLPDNSARQRQQSLDSGDLIRIISGKNRSALRWAAAAHAGQKRKGPDSEELYLLHPIAVANLLAGAGADRDLICAGCLHDTVEDTDITLEAIKQEFGSNVANLVESVTKDKTFKSLRLEEQAGKVVEKCETVAGQGGLALKAADLMVNLTDLVLDAEEHGPKHWQQVFGADRAHRKIAHYLELADLLTQKLTAFPCLALALQKRAGELRLLAKEFGWLQLAQS